MLGLRARSSVCTSDSELEFHAYSSAPSRVHVEAIPTALSIVLW
jgi:hypothetical protein